MIRRITENERSCNGSDLAYAFERNGYRTFLTEKKFDQLVKEVHDLLPALKREAMSQEFWERLYSFVKDVQTDCCMGEEEKDSILSVCEEMIGWRTSTPPDRLLEVKDKLGNIGRAQPIFNTFNIVNDKVVPCEPEWSGGWMIKMEGMELNIHAPIVGWREIINQK